MFSLFQCLGVKDPSIIRWAAVRVPDAGLSHTGDATASLLKQVLVSCLPFCLELAVGSGQ